MKALNESCTINGQPAKRKNVGTIPYQNMRIATRADIDFKRNFG